MKLLSNTKSKTTKVKNDGNVPHLEITEVVVFNCNILNKIINIIREFCIHLFQIGHFVIY